MNQLFEKPLTSNKVKKKPELNRNKITSATTTSQFYFDSCPDSDRQNENLKKDKREQKQKDEIKNKSQNTIQQLSRRCSMFNNKT